MHQASNTIMDIPVRAAVLYAMYGIVAIAVLIVLYNLPAILQQYAKDRASAKAKEAKELLNKRKSK
jgi:hypothetical protein